MRDPGEGLGGGTRVHDAEIRVGGGRWGGHPLVVMSCWPDGDVSPGTLINQPHCAELFNRSLKAQ